MLTAKERLKAKETPTAKERLNAKEMLESKKMSKTKEMFIPCLCTGPAGSSAEITGGHQGPGGDNVQGSGKQIKQSIDLTRRRSRRLPFPSSSSQGRKEALPGGPSNRSIQDDGAGREEAKQKEEALLWETSKQDLDKAMERPVKVAKH